MHALLFHRDGARHNSSVYAIISHNLTAPKLLPSFCQLPRFRLGCLQTAAITLCGERRVAAGRDGNLFVARYLPSAVGKDARE
jgi:hypothetical protein